MCKIISLTCLVLSMLSSHAQINFLGNSESLRMLNSSSGENYIFLDFSNSQIFFSREKHSENTTGTKDIGDIWVSQLDSAWSLPERMVLNDENFASPLGISQDGAYFLFNKTWYDKGLYFGGVFALPLHKNQSAFQVDIPYFKNRSPLQTGSLSKDGRHLLLSLENNLGYGVDDLFICILEEDGTWSPPKNLGDDVNTQFQEISPFLAEDNTTLIFASNGHGGLGSFDLYQTTRQDDTWQSWSSPVNLGVAVNSSGAETSFAFSSDSEYAYFVSTQSSDGYGDIKRIKITSNIEEVAVEEEVVMALEPETGKALSFVLVDKKTDDAIEGRAVITLGNGEKIVKKSDESGMVAISIEDFESIEFKADGYFSVKQAVLVDDSVGQITVPMESLEVGNVITLKNVLFYRGTANFVEGSESELDLIIEMLLENPDVEILLKGHTDNVGNDLLNVQLSKERVLAVEGYLIGKGIAESRIAGEGYGGAQPIASNEQESTRKLNRRVEFEIIRN